jgi:hypothetical protein
MDIVIAQRILCTRHGALWYESPGHLKLGVARNLKSTTLPIHGLRHPPSGTTTGWFVWAGEGDPLPDRDFFVPLHVEHLQSWRPEVMRFLGLPPGWRFLTDGTHDDVWEDARLLGV